MIRIESSSRSFHKRQQLQPESKSTSVATVCFQKDSCSVAASLSKLLPVFRERARCRCIHTIVRPLAVMLLLVSREKLRACAEGIDHSIPVARCTLTGVRPWPWQRFRDQPQYAGQSTLLETLFRNNTKCREEWMWSLRFEPRSRQVSA